MVTQVRRKPVGKTIRFADPVFLLPIVVVSGLPADWAREVKRVGLAGSEAPTGGTAWSFWIETAVGGWAILILLPPFDGTVDWLDSLLHECSHAVDRVLDKRGVPPGLESTEVRAYLNGFYFSSILRGLTSSGKLTVTPNGQLVG